MNLETKLTGDVFITSDTHYGHANICRGVSTWDDKTKCRDFDTVEKKLPFPTHLPKNGK